jgi:flagellar basal-body rod modification protein FlgD
MADIGATTGTSSGSSSASTSSAVAGTNGLQDLDINQFLKLMVSELMNQDPLNPMDNTQLVQQIGELRSIAASDQLTTSLQSLQTQQSLTTAASLIGKQVSALDSKNNNVSGTISAVTVQVDQTNNNKRSYQVKIGDQTVDLNNIREVDGSPIGQ